MGFSLNSKGTETASLSKRKNEGQHVVLWRPKRRISRRETPEKKIENRREKKKDATGSQRTLPFTKRRGKEGSKNARRKGFSASWPTKSEKKELSREKKNELSGSAAGRHPNSR